MKWAKPLTISFILATPTWANYMIYHTSMGTTPYTVKYYQPHLVFLGTYTGFMMWNMENDIVGYCEFDHYDDSEGPNNFVKIGQDTILVFNIDGRLVKRRLLDVKRGSNLIEMQLPEGIPTGIYILKVDGTDGDRSFTKFLWINKEK